MIRMEATPVPVDPYALTCPCACHGHGPGYRCTIEGGCGHLHRGPANLNPGLAGRDPICLGCGKPTAGDGANLCAMCTIHLRADLDAVDGLVVELEISRTKQDRIGGGTGNRRTADEPVGFRPAAMEAADVLTRTLTAWAADIAEQLRRPRYAVPTTDPVACAAWLIREIENIRRHPTAGACLDEIRFAVRVGYRTIDRPPEKVYAGPCVECRADLYGYPRAREVVCRNCGTPHSTADRRAEMLAALRDHLATAAEIAAGIGELYGETINRKRINQWHHRGRLVDHGVTLDTHDPLFRIGDVLDLAVSL